MQYSKQVYCAWVHGYHNLHTSCRLVLQTYGQCNAFWHKFCSFDKTVSHLNSTPPQLNTLLVGALFLLSLSKYSVNGDKLTLEILRKSNTHSQRLSHALKNMAIKMHIICTCAVKICAITLILYVISTHRHMWSKYALLVLAIVVMATEYHTPINLPWEIKQWLDSGEAICEINTSSSTGVEFGISELDKARQTYRIL